MFLCISHTIFTHGNTTADYRRVEGAAHSNSWK